MAQSTMALVALAALLGVTLAVYVDTGSGPYRGGRRGEGTYYEGTGNVIGSPKWGKWTRWTHCSSTCLGGYQTRSRKCEHPLYSLSLFGSEGDTCVGDSEQTRACNSHVHCKVDGGWSYWTSFSYCSASCGAGSKTRTRVCNNPTPAHGGAYCAGRSSDSMYCTGTDCKVDGGWSEWTYYSDCSASCGAGTKTKTRVCNNPTPAHGGAYCAGQSSDSMYCTGSSSYCPVDGAWSAWGSFSACSATCGSGTKTRYRTCSYPAPAYGGDDCYGASSETMSCTGSSGYCPVDGAWSAWGSFTACSATCGSGTKSRYRTCSYPAPAYGGDDCYGASSDTMSCTGSSGYCPPGYY